MALLSGGEALAYLDDAQPGRVLITKIRGREFRFQRKPEQTLRSRTAPAAPLRHRVCLLSARAAENLENWGMSQPCHGGSCRHSHHTREEIDLLEADGTVRYLAGRNVAAWVQTRHLVPRKSGPVTVVQLVPIGR